jgi:hypothetical protein
MAGPGGGPMAALVQMAMAQHPQGPNIGGPMSAGSGSSQLGPGDGSGGNGPETLPASGADPTQGAQGQGPAMAPPMDPNILQALAQASMGPQAANPQKGAQLVQAIQKLFPKLHVADHTNGTFELAGPAQDQFLASAYAKAHGAKTSSVHNTGKGQRLHVAVA